ncbi:YceI family protein [Chitinophaga qingshengii]|uniref:YceI family protein n=1 Tax=Chitinophaga qingshengii TaxID=1569794 RepID=A0ABR7TNQ4_9BACT|nr:YceI family protein [Chitinophaga qingshengii]MBC9931167.1 YceI family protein [Chitinophaga qingshengii]
MKNLILLLSLVIITGAVSAQDVFSCKNTRFSFFSSAPLEDIEAKTDKGVSAINVKTGAIYFKVPITAFQFKKKLMQEHFNQNYLESDKYPFAEFKGKVLDGADLSRNGTYEVIVEGTLNLHGVDKNYREKGTITVKDGNITAGSTFNISIRDHRIDVPSLVVKNVAEVVAVTVNAVYTAVNR